jgi:hypothetical protein
LGLEVADWISLKIMSGLDTSSAVPSLSRVAVWSGEAIIELNLDSESIFTVLISVFCFTTSLISFSEFFVTGYIRVGDRDGLYDVLFRLAGLIVFKGFGLILVVEVGDEIRAFDSMVVLSFTLVGDYSDSNFLTGLMTLLLSGKAVFAFLGEFWL